MNRKNFLLCGITGCCMEILFTAITCTTEKDYRFIGHTSLWMFPIYGMAALIKPVYQKIKKKPIFIRGLIYAIGIMSVEYISGSLLKKHQICPWDYSDSKANICGVIRLDYLPLWGLAGLAFERILCWHDKSP